jgi:hypothetical protein
MVCSFSTSFLVNLVDAITVYVYEALLPYLMDLKHLVERSAPTSSIVMHSMIAEFGQEIT